MSNVISYALSAALLPPLLGKSALILPLFKMRQDVKLMYQCLRRYSDTYPITSNKKLLGKGMRSVKELSNLPPHSVQLWIFKIGCTDVSYPCMVPGI